MSASSSDESVSASSPDESVSASPPDLSGLLGADGVRQSLADVVRLAAPVEIVPGWATVELARPAAMAAAVEPTTADHLLGAFAAIVRLAGSTPGSIRGATPRRVVLLEPSTEGPLAAALARHGEGWVAAYLRGSQPGAEQRLRDAGFSVSDVGRGPFGPERRVGVGRVDGPFVLVVSEP